MDPSSFLLATSFLAELLLCYLTGNIFGIEISCGRHESEILGEISLADDICHPHVIRKRAGRSHGATALHKADWLPCLSLTPIPHGNHLFTSSNYMDIILQPYQSPISTIRAPQRPLKGPSKLPLSNHLIIH